MNALGIRTDLARATVTLSAWSAVSNHSPYAFRMVNRNSDCPREVAPLFCTIRPFALPECGRSRLVGNKRHRVGCFWCWLSEAVANVRCRSHANGAVRAGSRGPSGSPSARQSRVVFHPSPRPSRARSRAPEAGRYVVHVGCPYRHVDAAAAHVWCVSSSRCEPVFGGVKRGPRGSRCGLGCYRRSGVDVRTLSGHFQRRFDANWGSARS